MAGPHVVLDACVLYPATLRDFLIELACTKIYFAHWTDQIQEEWTRNLLEQRPDLSRDALERTALLMDRAIPDARVSGYTHRAQGLDLPDSDDLHVLAAALHCGASQIVTFNLRDFPARVLGPLGVAAVHPDALACWALETDPDAVKGAVRATRTRLRNPPRSVEEHLERLRSQGLAQCVAQLEPFAQDL